MGAILAMAALAEDTSVINAYDEAHYARVLHYDRPIELSLQVLLLLAKREHVVKLVERPERDAHGQGRDVGALAAAVGQRDLPSIARDQIQ